MRFNVLYISINGGFGCLWIVVVFVVLGFGWGLVGGD